MNQNSTSKSHTNSDVSESQVENMIQGLMKTPQKYAGPKFHTSSPSANSLPIPVALMNTSTGPSSLPSQKSPFWVSKSSESGGHALMSTSLPTSHMMMMTTMDDDLASSVLPDDYQPPPTNYHPHGRRMSGLDKGNHALKDISYYSNKTVKDRIPSNLNPQPPHTPSKVKPPYYHSFSDPESFHGNHKGFAHGGKMPQVSQAAGKNGSRTKAPRDRPLYHKYTQPSSSLSSSSTSMNTHTNPSIPVQKCQPNSTNQESIKSVAKTSKGTKKILKRPTLTESSSSSSASAIAKTLMDTDRKVAKSLYNRHPTGTNSKSLREISLNLKQMLKIVDSPRS